MTTIRLALILPIALFLVPRSIASAQEKTTTDTPKEMVASYSTLADAILALKRTEANLVRSILATTHAHAELAMRRARQAIESSEKSTAAGHLEELATLIGQLGTEGDNSVAAIRKRLLEGGHHHNAQGEKQGIFDPGYVIVTRAAKQAFLDASRAIGQLSRSPDAGALQQEWNKVDKAYTDLMKSEK
jgi:hypothetical protein